MDAPRRRVAWRSRSAGTPAVPACSNDSRLGLDGRGHDGTLGHPYGQKLQLKELTK